MGEREGEEIERGEEEGVREIFYPPPSSFSAPFPPPRPVLSNHPRTHTHSR